MASDNSIPTATVHQPSGLITKMFQWVFHPYHADTDTWNWAMFVVLAYLAGYLWSKVVKQTLDAVI
jgi:hypothetical protein